MSTELVIVGAGGHAREVADIVSACRDAGADLTLRGFLDDDLSRTGETLCGHPVLGDTSWLEHNPDVEVVLGVGAPATKRRIALALARLSPRYRTLVHPRAELTQRVRLGEGVVVAAGCVVTNEVTVGAHVHLNRLSTVGHDCTLGDYVHLSPGAVLSGEVQIAEGCDIGTNACVIQNLAVGAWTIVGAGAAVVDNVPANATAVGVPARVISTRPSGWHT